MVAFKNSRALLLLIALSSLFLDLTFANDYPSPSQAPIAAETEVDGLSPPGSSESELVAPVSFISSSPDGSPASSQSPPPSASASSFSLSLSSFSTEDVGEIYGVLETPATHVKPVYNVAAGKDVQAKVSKVVGTNVIAVKYRTEEFMKNVILKRLHNPETEDETRECLNQCKENYSDANDDVSRVMDDLSTGDYYKAMVDVEGISTFVDTCYDCLKEMVGEEPEFKKFDEWVRGVTGDCLEQLEKVNS